MKILKNFFEEIQFLITKVQSITAEICHTIPDFGVFCSVDFGI